MSRMKPSGTDAGNQYLGGPSQAFSIDELGEREVEPVYREMNLTEIEKEAFMAEKLLVQIQDSNDDNAERIIPVWVNGRVQHFIRGVPIEVKRCYVERLARAKRTTFRQDLESDEPTKVNRINPQTALTYPFMVLQDNNPQGAGWLRQVLSEV